VRGTLHGPCGISGFANRRGNILFADCVKAHVGNERSRHCGSSLVRAVCNPFYVLGLTPAARAAQVTLRYRALQSDLGAGQTLTFATPIGTERLNAELLARAHTELRDPDLRLEHELRYVPAARLRSGLQVVRSEAP